MPLDDEDFADFVEARWAVLVRTARHLGCDVSAAEDLAQTTLVRAYRKWGKVAAARDPDAYVYGILVNALRKSWRRRWTAEHPTDTPDLDVVHEQDHADRVSTRVALDTALAELSQEQRSVLVLRYFADLSEGQVATALGVPVGTVKSRAARGLERLAMVMSGMSV